MASFAARGLARLAATRAVVDSFPHVVRPLLCAEVLLRTSRAG